MLRARNPRVTSKGCNPNNLHVISTAGYLSSKPLLQTPSKLQQPPPNSQPQQPFNKPQPPQKTQIQEPKTIPSVVPAVSVVNTIPFFNKSQTKRKFKNRYSKKRQERKRALQNQKRFATRTLLQNSNYQWFNPNFVPQVQVIDTVNTETPDAEIPKTEKAEVTPVAPVEENYFEEVEVASSEGEGKDVLVGFRKTKLHYLKYKKKCFFKPKIYQFSSQRTIVNCLNVEDKVSVEGSVDVDIVSEAEYDEYECDNLERSDSLEKIGNIIEIEEESNDTEEIEKVSIDKNEVSELPKKNFKTCIENGDNFFQGKSFIQARLDSWNSHLIGLEYLIEIQDKNNQIAVKYHCVLCDEDLEEIKESPDIFVLNHISGHKHVLKYLEKHFPACGYKFSKNCDFKFVVLQKLCAKINENLGYYSMCSTDIDYYAENGMKIKETIQNAFHPNENDFKLDISTFEKTVDSDLLGEVNNIINDIIEKAVPEKDSNSTENDSNKKIIEKIESDKKTRTKTGSVKIKDNECKKDIRDALKEELAKKPKSTEKAAGKHKGNNSISSYLRLSFAACGKLGKSNKVSTKKSQEISSKNIKLDDKKLTENKLNKIPKETVKSKTEENKKVTSVKEKVKAVGSVKSKNGQTDEQLMNKEVPDNFEAAQSNEVCDVTACNSKEKVQKAKEKVLLKSTLHSKHCRKTNCFSFFQFIKWFLLPAFSEFLKV